MICFLPNELKYMNRINVRARRGCGRGRGRGRGIDLLEHYLESDL